MVPSKQHLYQTIVLSRNIATGNIYDYLFCYCPLVGILFEVLRITVQYFFVNSNNILNSICQMQLLQLHFDIYSDLNEKGELIFKRSLIWQ